MTDSRTQIGVTDDELAEAKAELQRLQEQVRRDLAEDLGGEPEDYDSTRRPIADGGEE